MDAVIGLPANLFYGTTIPTCILIFKKTRNGNGDNVLFIDASHDYEKGKNQNILRDEHIDRIVNTYRERKDIEKYAHAATMEEIKENDYNLNIPRYVDTFEEEEQIDIQAEFVAMEELKKKSAELDNKLAAFFSELGL